MSLYRYRALTTQQIERLFFSDTDGNSAKHVSKPNTRCQYRLQLLYHYGYLLRDEQPQRLSDGRKPFVYWLDKKGAQLVAELLDGENLDWNPREHNVSYPFLDHLLATNGFRVAISLAARKYRFTIATWLDDRTLKRQHMTDTITLTSTDGRRRKAAIVPDGYFVIDTGTHLYHHFLEADLSTVTGASSVWGRRDWSRKVAAYLEYYRSGKYQEHYGTQGLRILTVTRGEKRLVNLKAATEKAGGRSRFWFTTFERLIAADVMFDPIWQKAGDDGLHTLIW